MNTRQSRYLRHRSSSKIVSHAIWFCCQLTLSFRKVENLLAERGNIVPYETVREWCRKFGPDYAHQRERQMRGFKSPDQLNTSYMFTKSFRICFELLGTD